MGSVISGDSVLHLDDATLTHLQYAIVQRYRRGESFLLTWTDDAQDLEQSLWLSPSAPISFEFDAAGEVSIDPAWIAALDATVDATGGLQIVGRDGGPLRVGAERRAA